jgi:hypothetical protein
VSFSSGPNPRCRGDAFGTAGGRAEQNERPAGAQLHEDVRADVAAVVSRRVRQQVAIGAERCRRAVVELHHRIVARPDDVDADVGHVDHGIGRLRHADVGHVDQVVLDATERGDPEEEARMGPHLESERRFIEVRPFQLRIDRGERRIGRDPGAETLNDRSLDHRCGGRRRRAIDVCGRRGRIAVGEVGERQAVAIAPVIAEAGEVPEIEQPQVKAAARQEIAPVHGPAVRLRGAVNGLDADPAVQGEAR